MRFFIIIISCLLFCFESRGQGESAESILLDLYHEGEYAEVVEKVDSVLKNNKNVNLSRMHQIKADALYFLNDVDASLDNYLLTIDYLDQYPIDTVYLIESYSHAGFCLKYLGKYVNAIPYYEKALKICELKNDSIEIANQLSHLGEIYAKLSNYSKAKTYYDQAYQINFDLKDSVAIGYDLVDLGDLNLLMKEYLQAINYYKEGIKVRKTRAQNHNTHSLRLGKLSHAYIHAGQTDSALHYINLAIKEAAKLNDSLSMAKHWIVKAEILASNNSYDSAIYYGNKSRGFFEEEDYNSFKTDANIVTANIYQSMNQLRKAKSILLEEKKRLRDFKRWDKLVEVYTALLNIAEKEGNYKEALGYAKSFNIVNDSILKNEKYQTILSLETSFNTKQKEQEIELLKSKEKLIQLKLQQKKNNILVLTVLLVLVIFIAVFIYISVKRKHRLERELLSAQINEMRSQFKMLLDDNEEGIEIDQDKFNEKLDNPLSSRELEILTYALSNLTNQEIADKVFVSVNTVKFHLKNIYDKLGVSNRKEVIKFALSSSRVSN